MLPEKFNEDVDCYCTQTSCEQLRKTIADKGCKSLQDVQQYHSRVGKQCGVCRLFIEKWCEQNGRIV